MKLPLLLLAVAISMASFGVSEAFAPRTPIISRETTFLLAKRTARKINDNEVPNRKISNIRRKQLGIADDEDEYDLDIALDMSTDPFITKVIAGSLILAITALLVAGIVIPATTDYGEGVCNALLTGGRC
jgi:hypothetical protein